MSEDANNLCTTEDAFESFQANSMYQEDEYITLSDLVSPEPVAPDLTNELNEIPYDNEVVLISNAADCVEVSTTSDPVFEETIQPTVEPSEITTVSSEVCEEVSTTSYPVIEETIQAAEELSGLTTVNSEVNIENPVNTSNENPVNGKPKTRKKKMLYGGTSEFSSNFSGSFDTFLKFTKGGAQENSIPNPNLIVDSDRNPRKRTRKSDTLVEENSAVVDVASPLKHVSKFGRTIKHKTNIDMTPNSDYETKKASSRRGRPKKKAAIDKQPPLDADSTNLTCSLVSSEMSHSENDGIDDLSFGIPRKSVKRRGRPKKDLQNNQIGDKSLSDEVKKRGRPRKGMGNDEIDNMSLGTLSEVVRKRGKPRNNSDNNEIEEFSLDTGVLSDGVKRQSKTRKNSGTDEMSLGLQSDDNKKQSRPEKEIGIDEMSLGTLNDGVKKCGRPRKDSSADEIDEISLSTLSEKVKKRGRPRKDSGNEDEMLDTLTYRVNKRGRPRIDSDSDEIDELSLSMLGDRVKRQGRQRKEITSHSTLANNSVTSSVIENLDSDNKDNIILNNLNLKAKRGRQKRVSSVSSLTPFEQNSIDNTTEDFVNEDNKDLNTITLSEKEQIDCTDLQSMNDILTEIKKSPGKRGRKPKKQFNNAPSEDVEAKVEPNKENNEDKTDDLCLSQLKECESNKPSVETDDIDFKAEINTDIDKPQSTSLNVDSLDLKYGDITNKRNSKMAQMSDFEYNVDSIVVKDEETAYDKQDDDINSLLVEDPSKRPTRRKVKKTLHYDEGSDEDPFANVELSDDDEPRRRKGTKCYSDDEYIPDSKIDKLGLSVTADESSDSDIDETLDELIMQKKRRSPKKGSGQGPSKKIKKSTPDITTVTSKTDSSTGDIEGSLQSSVIKAGDDLVESEPLKNWGMSNEFENFIAKKIQGTNLKIKKVSSNASTEGSLTPLEIPTINVNEAKKTIEMFCQTKPIHTESVAVQTSVPYDLPMKENLPLTPEQSEKACEFLNSIVKTTAELGQLMTEKSEDFIKKKINTTHVVDTFKMDYCVKKSFLLFKLAKHNLMQMEEDLSKQYDEFLKSNDLIACREQIKEVKPKLLTAPTASDSDCEIVEETAPVPAPKKRHEKPKFNPKTVFLNKELSIKIAKKPTEDKKLNIKGRHTVWINDSVMVKKVKPTQSFLAQDSRNKKPPDNFILAKMVSDFFRNYNRAKIISMCAPFTSAEWLNASRVNYVCNYFVVTPSECTGDTNYQQNNSHYINETTESNSIVSEPNCSHILSKGNSNNIKQPETLLTLCTHALQNHLKMINFNAQEASHDNSNQLTDGKNSKRKPVTLFRLCVGVLNEGEMDTKKIIPSIETPPHVFDVMSLKSLCYRRTIELFSMSNFSCDSSEIKPQSVINDTIIGIQDKVHEQHDHTSLVMYASKNKIKSLFTICVEFLQKKQQIGTQCINIDDHITSYTASSLQHIAFVNIRNILYQNEAIREKCVYEHSTDIHKSNKSISDSIKDTSAQESSLAVEALTINCINTLSDEAFQNFDEPVLNIQDNSQYLDDNSNYDEEFDTDYNNFEDDQNEGDNWVSQVQMQEFRSCFTPNNEPPLNENNIFDEELAGSPNIALVKVEPLDEMADNIVDTAIIKTEPESNLDEMTIIPDSIITKSEMSDQPSDVRVIERQNSNSYDVDSFESFVSSNKMMRSLNDNGDEIFSQSGLRVRRQHEPDYAQEYDAGMSLLIPQTYEPLNIENAKDDLMESSSDDTTSDAKLKGKKKIDKRKGKQKKTEPKSKIKEAVTKTKDKLAVDNEVAVLTRRMREKIRQEEKRVESSDSEDENMTLNLRKEKDKKESIEKLKPSKSTKKSEDEIQCNNVDSTEQVNDNTNKSNTPIEKDKFTGFSAIDQNEISSYQKYMKYVYDKIIPNVDEKVDEQNNEKAVPVENNMELNNERSQSPLIDYTEPAELLECEPTMPIFDDINARPQSKKKDIVHKNKEKQISNVVNDKNQYTDRHGWKCYPVDCNDAKLYQNAYIPLEKLPEDFVDTYLMYQDITDRDKEDEEVNRLINLNSLNRPNIKDIGTRSRLKMRNVDGQSVSGHGSESNSRAASPANSDHYAELTPSEDEEPNVDDELPPPAPRRQTAENSLAKNLLMNDNDSDSDSGPKKIKEEIIDEDKTRKDYKPGPKSKRKQIEIASKDSENLMLTADKMMNKELTLLHAPIVLKTEVPETPAKGPSTRHKQKSATKNTPTRDNTKADDSEESEEEKREKWVSTKEKLLKRIQKKEDASIEDAKRAKLVSEFIERRGDAPELQNRSRGRSRRSRKKFLERQKQLGVLSKELFGETSDSIGVSGKRSAAAAYKGRRNIRKVIDKKSLARSTVIANMEEFERKRRLSMRQSRLTELLGCEEGVNVLVINDEVCLEYDFDENRPIVTVHPFFTKVMKAHQYEGVKFMWDACFESLSNIEAGHPGGGCILAHCMGLGKTLQVLALLHTVLTHPRAAMQRVLVCCPLSTVLNWVDEIHQWIGPVTDQIKVFELSKLKKTYERAYQLEDWYNGGGIFIIGYELFRSLTTLDPVLDDIRPTVVNKIRNALLNPGPDIIVCDEGHLLKNDCSVLAVAMSRVVTKRRIVLTGTPMQNNLREYYCMVNFVKPNLLGTYSEYSNRFENPIMNGQHRDSIDQDIKLMKARTHILHKVLEGCLQRQEASVLYPYLPKKHEYTVFIPLTKCQWDLYKHYLNVYANQSKQSVLKDFHILQKIWSHPQVLHFFQTKKRDDARNKFKVEKLEDDLAQEDLGSEDIKPSDTEVWWLQYLEGGKMLDMLKSSNKFVAVFRILDECIKLGDKVLIFSTSLFCLDALEYFLKKINKWSLGQEYYRLDGSVPAEVRQKWCREFNADHNHKTKLFLISTRAGCLGLNMTAANRVIILDTSWNPAHDIQSIFRVYRFGQKKDCFIYRLVALGTMEQKIYERSVTKQAVACRVVDEQQIDRHYNMAELTELYRFDEAGVGVPGGVAVGVQDVALLRVARDAALHAVHEHDSLLRGSTEQSLPEHERAAAWMQFQQEHAHKQMQNDIDANNEKHLKLLHESSKKQSIAHNVIKVKVEDQETPVLAEPIPSVSDPKTKKGRKSSVVKCFIPIKTEIEPQPGPSNVDQDAGDEEETVKQIAHILIKHNFQNRKGPSEISALVNSVRKIVHSGKSSKLDMSDELTASIAKVLLEREGKTMPVLLEREGKTMPALTDVMRVTAGPSLADIAVRKRGRRKKLNEESDLQIASAIVPDEDPSTEIDGRKKRKAALVAEKHLDSMAKDCVIELDDDDWRADNDTDFGSQFKNNDESTKTPLLKNDKAQPPAKKTLTQAQSKNYNTPLAKNCAAPIETLVENDSILLSDDDEPTFITPEKATVVEKPTTAKKSSIVENPTTVEKLTTIEKPITDEKPITVEKPVTIEKPQRPGPASKKLSSKQKEAEQPESEKGPLPLHRSLLSNKNFIKIVAHTYLAGNPMLDEDAATLAAQYSTFKALKEVEASGKEIDSGPIYDIAVRVLGVDILKKLHKTNIQTKTSAQENSTTQQVQDKMETAKTKIELLKSSESPVIDKPLERAKPKVGVIKLAALRPSPAKQLPPIVQPNGPDVVPVGFFKRTTNMSTDSIQQSSGGESILPDDDDDVRIVSNPLPAYPPHPGLPPNVVPVKPITVSRRNIKQPILLSRNINANEVTGAGDQFTPVANAVPAPSRHIEISSGRVVVPQAPVKVTSGPRTRAPPTVPEPAPTSTICLDSDDEESILPYTSVPGPVPVAMTTGGILPQVVPMSLTAASALPPKLLNPTLSGPSNNILYLAPNQNYLLPTAMTPLNQQQVQIAPSPLNTILQRKLQDNSIPAAAPPSPMPETIVPTEASRRLVPGKTFCKPGDILRVTKSGQIEVLTQCDKPVIPSTMQASEPLPPAVIPPAPPAEESPPVEAESAQTATSEESQVRTTRKRIRVMSSSSSSSDSSRSSSPEDPLSIFKDVVHIQAAYQPKTKPKPPAKKAEEVKIPEKPKQKILVAPTTAKSSAPGTTKSSAPGTTKSSAPTTTKLSAPATTKLSTPTAKLPVKENAKKTNRSIISISQESSKPTSTLNTSGSKNVESGSSLLKAKASKQQNATADIVNRVNRSLSSGSNTGRINLTYQTPSSTIDLTDIVVPKQNTATKQNTSAGNKSTPAKGKSLLLKFPEKKSATTVVGTSKSLILDGKSITTASKKLPSTVDLTGQKSIQITNVKMIQPSSSNKSGDKKRPAVETTAPKKKKTEQMTLKDFNIDDIDDIIELE